MPKGGLRASSASVESFEHFLAKVECEQMLEIHSQVKDKDHSELDAGSECTSSAEAALDSSMPCGGRRRPGAFNSFHGPGGAAEVGQRVGGLLQAPYDQALEVGGCPGQLLRELEAAPEGLNEPAERAGGSPLPKSKAPHRDSPLLTPRPQPRP